MVCQSNRAERRAAMTNTALATEWPVYPDLAGKAALVTGGSKALGAAACRALAANGVAVAVSGRDTEALNRVVTGIPAAGGRAVAIPADVTDPDAVAALAAEAASHLV